MLSYLAQVACVYFHATVSERWTRLVTTVETDSEGKSRVVTRTETGWSVVHSEGYSLPFDLRDETGAVQVQPLNAVVEANTIFSATVGTTDPLYFCKGPAGGVAGSDYIRRFEEVALFPGLRVFVVGAARERQDRVEAEIANGRAGDRFLITTRSEAQVIRGHGWARVGLLLFIAFLFPALPNLFTQYSDNKLPAGQIAAATAAVWLILLLAEGIATLNVMKEMVRRTKHADALIDVQLKRRADLIPLLTRAAKAAGGMSKKFESFSQN